MSALKHLDNWCSWECAWRRERQERNKRIKVLWYLIYCQKSKSIFRSRQFALPKLW